MKFQLPKDVQQVLSGLIDSKEARKRALLIIDKLDIEDDVKEAYRAAIELQENPKMTQTIKDALRVEGMSEYIDSLIAEKTQPLADEIEALKAQLADKDAKISEAEAALASVKDELEAAKKAEDVQKAIYVDAIADMALALRKSEIDLTAVDDSLKAYKEGLQDKTAEELKALFDEMSKELHSTFQGEPTDKVEDPVNRKDPTKQEDTKDSEEDKQEEEIVDIDEKSGISGLLRLFATK
jgi:uncharacterized small protein (DUF1192 family)